MPFINFVNLVDLPNNQETPTHIAKEWEFAQKESVSDIKRGMFLNMIALAGDQNTISRLLAIYKQTSREEVKSKVIQALQSNYQNKAELISKDEMQQLKAFFSKELHSKVRDVDADMIVRGYISLYSAESVLAEKDLINKQLNIMEPRLKLGLQLNIADKSKALESIYMQFTVI